MGIKKLLNDWLSSGKEGLPVEENKLAGSQYTKTADDVFMSIHLITQIIRIQGLEKTLEDLNTMSLKVKPGCHIPDVIYIVTWESLRTLKGVIDASEN